MTDSTQKQWIAGFWQRIAAMVLDFIVLGLLGFLSSLIFRHQFEQMGTWGFLVGFSIALIYFGVMNSKLANGQTIGKKILKIKVVNQLNQPIGLGRSIVRYIILVTPFFLSNQWLLNQYIVTYLSSVVIFAVFFSLLYLYIFNKATRQSLHDLAVGTLVVNCAVEQQEIKKTWYVHYISVLVIFLIAAIIPYFTSRFTEQEVFKNLRSTQMALTNQTDINRAAISVNSNTFTDANKVTLTSNTVNANVLLKHNNINDEKLARQLAIIVITHYPKARNLDSINITLTYGFDIKIWSQWSSQFYQFDPKTLSSPK